MKRKNKIFAALGIVLVIISLYFLYSLFKPGTFRGKISEGTCSEWIGGGECMWRVDDKEVFWSGGSAITEDGYGRIEGLKRTSDSSKTPTLMGGTATSGVGQTVEVYAHEISPNSYVLENDTHYIKAID